MSTSQRRLQRLGILGLAASMLLMASGVAFAGELSGLLSGYGLMLAGSALYLLVGVRLVAWRRAAVAQQTTASVKRDLLRQS